MLWLDYELAQQELKEGRAVEQMATLKFKGIIGILEETKVIVKRTDNGNGTEVFLNDIKMPNVLDYKIVLSGEVPHIEIKIVATEIEVPTQIELE